ncbi:hypothetical protein FHL15_005239 [Xylaria flabelliformis]|uniref:Uncharacterized protein n=1 Tax=Xylaria flabelliformis TaxID=2512241 RepID=A0A553I0X3_9PEZI|nr:hypothetical protein FHL15_005239 [Xylaria flabelliformis]
MKGAKSNRDSKGSTPDLANISNIQLRRAADALCKSSKQFTSERPRRGDDPKKWEDAANQRKSQALEFLGLPPKRVTAERYPEIFKVIEECASTAAIQGVQQSPDSPNSLEPEPEPEQEPDCASGSTANE